MAAEEIDDYIPVAPMYPRSPGSPGKTSWMSESRLTMRSNGCGFQGWLSCAKDAPAPGSPGNPGAPGRPLNPGRPLSPVIFRWWL